MVKVLLSQQDSAISKLVLFGVCTKDYSNQIEYLPIDTLLDDVYHYSFDGRDNIASLGNFGLNYDYLLFQNLDFGFTSGDQGFSYLEGDEGRTIVYKTKIPFARVSYLSGPKKFQKFDVLFTESINDHLNFSINYNTHGSNGFYINQETTGQRFAFTSNYNSRNDRYGAFLKYRVTSGAINENGGIKSDSVYSILTDLSPFDADNNKLKVQVWQENAKNRYDYRNVELSQFYRIGKLDSTKSFLSKLIIGLNSEGFIYDSWYEDAYSDSNYFAQFGLAVTDSVPVMDKFHNVGSKNYLFGKYEFKLFKLSVGANFNFYRNITLVKESNIQENSFRVSISDLTVSKFKFNGNFVKGLDGFNKEGHLFQVITSGSVFKDALNLNVRFTNTRSLPSYKMINYNNSILGWNNDFKYVDETEILFKIGLTKFKIGLNARWYTVNNYVYYGKEVAPVQFGNSFNGYEFKLNKKFSLKKVHFDVELINQDVENNAPVNLSNWIWKASIYHQRFLFNNAMEIKYGLDYWQNSLYTANSYAPFSRTFNYQSSYYVGNFPYLNVFLSARIKGAQGFVNFQNVGQILFKENYMMVPDYPMQDYGFSFGIQWDFYN
tara:strand:- start:21622 stop:23433 length:1812 start_codon:yes stop_codon:yes gene_type:complete